MKEGTIDLEGSEEFVSKYLDEFKIYLNNVTKYPPKELIDTTVIPKKTDKNNSTKTSRKSTSFSLIPLNLKKDNEKPSLVELFTEKTPKTNQEIVTLFAYYLKNYLHIEEMQPGHALFCFSEIKKPKPLSILQLFRDASYHHKWLESSTTPNTTKITVAGENLIDHDLPHNS